MSRFGRLDFWNERYSTDKRAFEFYQSFDTIGQIIKELIPQDARVLYVGCGTSLLPDDMIEAGYESIDCIDWSQPCIEMMQRRHAQTSGISFQVMDATDMTTIDSESYDAVIEKGTLDCLICGQLDKSRAMKFLSEVHRILKMNGTFISVSFREPEIHSHFYQIEEFTWTLSVSTLPRPALSGPPQIAQEQESSDPSQANPATSSLTSSSLDPTPTTSETSTLSSSEGVSQPEKDQQSISAPWVAAESAIKNRQSHFLYSCRKPPPVVVAEDNGGEESSENGGEQDLSASHDNALSSSNDSLSADYKNEEGEATDRLSSSTSELSS
ncbi:putative Endothelin-converting enzyme 2 C (Ece2C) [Monocercomonoides exilis]|uniref:putative Endothelin-converting enzyme 2 C (Ece2C) n=1 Tax=Monocercomonoides exilis TaxID=2049356 RepID=UPI00355A3D19|nr:putative Endothelin-converting enzyme 2 C (Ece2C) [Monocercomonoides exilis]|eukprot:MONOS_4642.1-p1 / transcript=MONOS_4642.1 / gene=MONOS_4642 / organism=Monocercomonoides_exilis_PA203 / gene_product=Endothelin-converting enzyme 2 C (Ece2C) / transcript_product=Endothelin-converting enzyme 2 C (Ece2C) / location=Mono_scaffold00125:89976-91472(+) / protein_length=326 / sequence_SO=supercontig / SO=protein_coding / is_pseudo=false